MLLFAIEGAFPAADGSHSLNPYAKFWRGVSASEAHALFENKTVGDFCFPLGPGKPQSTISTEEYSFTLTQDDGTRLHGCCRKLLPPGSGGRLPHVAFAICSQPLFSLLYKALEMYEIFLRNSNTDTPPPPELTDKAPTAQFLDALWSCMFEEQEAGDGEDGGGVRAGEIVRVSMPLGLARPVQALVSPQPYVSTGPLDLGRPLLVTEKAVEMQVPPDCGTGRFGGSVCMAALLWNLPLNSVMTLVASLLLERRVLVVSGNLQVLSAAVQAAVLLLHPFRWQHIFMPVLPQTLLDYLTSPIPYLLGLPAQLLPQMKALKASQALEEVVVLDLEGRTCTPSPGSAQDDALLLPWADRLEAALASVISKLRGPQDYDGNAGILSVMQNYFTLLLARYRYCIRLVPADMESAQQGGAGEEKANGSLEDAWRGGAVLPGGRAVPEKEADEDAMMLGHGRWWFDHAAFVVSHRRSAAARQLLRLMRHSQLYEVFVRERLLMAAQEYAEPDAFEARVSRSLEASSSSSLTSVHSMPAPSASSRLSRMRSSSASVLTRQRSRQPSPSASVTSTPRTDTGSSPQEPAAAAVHRRAGSAGAPAPGDSVSELAGVVPAPAPPPPPPPPPPPDLLELDEPPPAAKALPGHEDGKGSDASAALAMVNGVAQHAAEAAPVPAADVQGLDSSPSPWTAEGSGDAENDGRRGEAGTSGNLIDLDALSVVVTEAGVLDNDDGLLSLLAPSSAVLASSSMPAAAGRAEEEDDAWGPYSEHQAAPPPPPAAPENGVKPGSALRPRLPPTFTKPAGRAGHGPDAFADLLPVIGAAVRNEASSTTAASARAGSMAAAASRATGSTAPKPAADSRGSGGPAAGHAAKPTPPVFYHATGVPAGSPLLVPTTTSLGGKPLVAGRSSAPLPKSVTARATRSSTASAADPFADLLK